MADLLGDNNYDGIYASTMVRTQLTAAPMSPVPGPADPGRGPGVPQRDGAVVFDGLPEAEASACSGYI